jgi:hypothetical protein
MGRKRPFFPHSFFFPAWGALLIKKGGKTGPGEKHVSFLLEEPLVFKKFFKKRPPVPSTINGAHSFSFFSKSSTFYK